MEGQGKEDGPMKSPVRSLALALLGTLSGLQVACAHAPARTDDQAQVKKAPPQRVLVTGSRIPQRVDPSTGLPVTFAPVRIYSRDQINDTGRQTDLGAALRTLDPGITP
jgi:hypothetical protein